MCVIPNVERGSHLAANNKEDLGQGQTQPGGPGQDQGQGQSNQSNQSNRSNNVNKKLDMIASLNGSGSVRTAKMADDVSLNLDGLTLTNSQ